MSNVQMDRINKVLSESTKDIMSQRVIDKLFSMEYKYKVGQKFAYHIDYSDSHPRCGIIIGINPDKKSYVVRWNDGEVSDDFPEYYIEPIEESKSSPVILKGWIARDEGGELNIFDTKPKRVVGDFWMNDECYFLLRDLQYEIEDAFPDLTWEDEPKKVEITIKIKEK